MYDTSLQARLFVNFKWFVITSCMICSNNSTSHRLVYQIEQYSGKTTEYKNVSNWLKTSIWHDHGFVWFWPPPRDIRWRRKMSIYFLWDIYQAIINVINECSIHRSWKSSNTALVHLLQPRSVLTIDINLSSMFKIKSWDSGCQVNVYSDHGCVYITTTTPGLRMQLQVGLISCAAVTRGKKPLPLLVKYIESR